MGALYKNEVLTEIILVSKFNATFIKEELPNIIFLVLFIVSYKLSLLLSIKIISDNIYFGLFFKEEIFLFIFFNDNEG